MSSEEYRAKKRAQYAANREKIRARKRAWAAAHRDAERARCRAWYAEQPKDARVARAIAWRDANQERWSEYSKAYREANGDRLRAADRARYAEDPQAAIDATRAWQIANPERTRAMFDAWCEANPERLKGIRRKAHHLRRARLAGSNSPGVTPAEWTAIVDAYDGRCAYCPQPGATVDHVIPISRGGQDAPDNVVPACLSCNSSKNDTPLAEWLASPAYARRLAKAGG